jgi:hypothetical protein
MFGWFRPRCPVDTWEKTWTEQRMFWLAQRLGLEKLQRARVVTPTPEFFPGEYHASAQDADRFMSVLCPSMGLDSRSLKLEVVRDEQLLDAVGLYRKRRRPEQRSRIWIAESQLADPEALAATLAHELAHELLLGHGLLDTPVEDHEWLTDLTPVFLGVGIFAANATIREAHASYGNWSWWQMHRQGYLPSRMLGYGLALFAFARGERSPEWRKHLRLDAASAVRDGLRYLEKTGDTTFLPDRIETPAALSAGEVVVRLRSPSASVRLVTLWQLEEQGPIDSCFDSILACLDDSDPAIPAVAAGLLPDYVGHESRAVEGLRNLLLREHAGCQALAAEALGRLGAHARGAGLELASMLTSEDSSVCGSAAAALARSGTSLEGRARRLLFERLAQTLVDCDYGPSGALAEAVMKLVDDPESEVREYVGRRGKEVVKLVLAALEDARGREGKSGKSATPTE